ncbi:MAG: hypothetical protein MRZ42_04205 [Tenericutes bacterium]|nr:hypothetical protein [Mycoplasmatota bacterium]
MVAVDLYNPLASLVLLLDVVRVGSLVINGLTFSISSFKTTLPFSTLILILYSLVVVLS